MSKSIPHSVRWLPPLIIVPILWRTAHADNFAKIHYDRRADELVVTMSYRGTNPNHNFTLKWGECLTDQSEKWQSVTVEVLDDQFDDRAQQSYKTTTRFSLSELPCSRPASVTLRTAPRFFYTLTIPKATQGNR
jgi:hypothetical protein